MRQLAKRQLEILNELLEGFSCSNDTFLEGKLGQLFYYYHLYTVTAAPGLRQRTEVMLDEVLNNISAVKPGLDGAALSYGGAGLGYAINFMSQRGFLKFEVDNEFDKLDRFLFYSAEHFIEEDNTDLLHGAAGIIHYFTEKANASVVVNEYLDILIEKLCNSAVTEDSGCWFRNAPARTNGRQLINLSLPHGLCGILLVLIKAYERSGHKNLIRNTVEEGIRFILKHKMDIDFSRGEYSFFPVIIDRDADGISAPNMLGWCAGDISMVLLLYRAAKLLRDASLCELADLIGMQTMMRRDVASTLVTSANFYHGAAGIAQCCHALYEESGNITYHESYEYWIDKTIQLLEEEMECDIYNGKENDVLEGVPGIAMVLLSYVSAKELHWSRAFLL
ncbi:lanthionine synthetase C family protein [Chitinophaga nivalis]|uniref:Lanthionine synthetase C family protein n=1 Tax=Chitinophaga nivalis TaxID=2991709 RepID=A0ABT3IGU0_9BACT|nr:lanthionine synthetase C family protein [Chitinophaga nivalis]MCW3467124.1 lanthionine synthetase C family protein [Chitinophaga nivalis]MCW3483185.1 lanthionine synthetase C family protein [Chitinophaga nivalis]